MKSLAQKIAGCVAVITSFATAVIMASPVMAAPIVIKGDDLNDQSQTMIIESVDADLSGSVFKAIPLAYYSAVAVDGNTVTGYNLTTDDIPPSITAAIDTAVKASGADITTLKDGLGNSYNAANPMPWVVHNLLDSSTSPWAGKLRDFLDQLKNQNGIKTATGQGSQTVSDNKHTATISGLRPGVYIIEDTTTGTGKQASIVGMNGTGVNNGSTTVTKLQGTDSGSQEFTLGTIEYKTHGVSVEKSIDSVTDHGTVAKMNTALTGTADHATIQIGSENSMIKMRLVSEVPNWTGYDKYYYALNDTYSKGLKIVDGSFTVSVDGKALTEANYDVAKTNGAFTIRFGAQGSTPELRDLVAQKGVFPVGAAVVVTYNMKLTGEARQGSVDTNTVKVEHSNNPNQWDQYATKPGNTVDVYTGKVNVKKTSMDGTALAGAKFKLYDKSVSDANQRWIVKLADGRYRLAEYGETGAVTEMTTAADGTLEIQGLSNNPDDTADRYALQETVSPYGTPQALLPTVEFTVHVDPKTGSYTVSETGGDNQSMVTVTDNTITVRNARSLMEVPKTGSALLILTAAVLVIAGGVVLIINSRKSND